MSPTDLLAVVDLGSNSFRLEIARLEENRLLSLLYRKETVRLAGGFAPDGTLTPDMESRALAALTRFRECLLGVAPENVLVVGTHAMRRASQNTAFLRAAERALGAPIEIISGEREASFAFSGAVRSLPYSAEERLVVDIGGGSTEMASGHGTTIGRSASYPVGCVSASIGFFPDGRITPDRQEAALAHAMTVLADAAKTFPGASSSEAYMTAGTFRAVVETCRNLGWTKDEVRLEHIEELIARLLRSKGRFAQAFPGMRADRFETANLLQWQEGPLPEDPSPDEDDPFWRAVLALRLALVFLQARIEPSFPDMRYDESSDTLTLPATWLQGRPLTNQCLYEEEERWKDAGLSLRICRE